MKMKNSQKIKETAKSKKMIIIPLLFIVFIVAIIGIVATIYINNRPLNQMKDAKEEAKVATAKRQSLMKVQVQLLDITDEEGNINLDKLNENLSKIEGIKKTDNVTKLPVTISVDGYEITINENGEAELTNSDEN